MRQIGGGRCDTCGRLGRQVGSEESPGGSGGSQEGSLGWSENIHFLFFRGEFVNGPMKY